MATTDTAPAVSTKVVTGMVRFSYLHVFKPAAAPGSTTEKYSASLIIPKSDKETLRKINAAIEAAKIAGKEKLSGKGKLKLPLRDGDEERDGDDAYAGCFFLNASSNTKPGVVDKDVNPIMEQDEVYSGCYGRASINFYAFNTSGNKGIACGLNNIQKVKDGEALGGSRSKAEDDFAEVLDEDDDLLG
jgi:hypothetical protein